MSLGLPATLAGLGPDGPGVAPISPELRAYALELEQAVKERTRAVRALEEANRELDAFSYSVSHDLRAPLRAIDGFSRIVLEEHAAQLPAEARHYLGRIRRGVQEMGMLVDDLLALSRVGRAALRLEPVQPAALVARALETLEPERQGREVEIVVGDLAACEADPTLLRQVWANLLANALKFTRPRAVARIEVGSSGTTGDCAYYVRDNGVGFDMRHATKLFGVFQRLHSTEDYEGTGIGLAIVQRVVHRHGGRVWAEAEPDRGATFSFTLPKGPRDA